MIGLTVAVTSGGQWPRARLREAGYIIAAECPRCGGAAETLFHRIWSCPKNVRHKDYDDSERLIEQARTNWEASPSLWLRGVPSRPDTCPVFDEEKEPVAYEFGSFASAPRDAEGFVTVFGDGSG
eukprot:8733837-Pyramimonas_sp.AAC.1